MGGGNGFVFIMCLLLDHLSARREQKLSRVFGEWEGRLLLPAAAHSVREACSEMALFHLISRLVALTKEQ